MGNWKSQVTSLSRNNAGTVHSEMVHFKISLAEMILMKVIYKKIHGETVSMKKFDSERVHTNISNMADLVMVHMKTIHTGDS